MINSVYKASLKILFNPNIKASSISKVVITSLQKMKAFCIQSPKKAFAAGVLFFATTSTSSMLFFGLFLLVAMMYFLFLIARDNDKK